MTSRALHRTRPQRPRRRALVLAASAAALSALAPGGRATSPVAAQDEAPDVTFLAGSYVDYAPSGMPDFSQCRPGWDRPATAPGLPGQWTYAAPVALANALWWLDSRAEPVPRDPSQPSDGHPLVTAYPAFGPRRDDHAVDNLPPLVADLAGRVNTDGRRRPDTVRGSRWEDVVEGATAFVGSRAEAHYAVEVRDVPDAAWLAGVPTRAGAAVLALGVWERGASGWTRVGGHYAALAGTDATGEHVALSDPLADHAAEGSAGRAIPPAPGEHSCRNNPRAHDDAAVVAHDVYTLFPPPDLPDGRVALAGYFTPETFGEGAAFAGLNPIDGLASHAGDWERGLLVMAVDAGLAILPRVAPSPAPTTPPSATAPPTAPPEPTATPSPNPPTGTATASPAASPSAVASPTVRAGDADRGRVMLPYASYPGLPSRPIVRPRAADAP